MLEKYNKWVLQSPRRFILVFGILFIICGLLMLQIAEILIIEIFAKVNIAIGFFSVGVAITNIIPKIDD